MNVPEGAAYNEKPVVGGVLFAVCREDGFFVKGAHRTEGYMKKNTLFFGSFDMLTMMGVNVIVHLTLNL